MLQRYIETLTSYAESSYDSSIIGEHELRLAPTSTIDSTEVSGPEVTAENSEMGSESRPAKDSEPRPANIMKPENSLPNSDIGQEANAGGILTRSPRESQIDKTETPIERGQILIERGQMIATETTVGKETHNSEDMIVSNYSDIKPKYLSGLFSSSTITSLHISAIALDMIHILERYGILYEKVHGGFFCSRDIAEEPLRFIQWHIFIIKVPLINMHGIQFKKTYGSTVDFLQTKRLILSSLRL